ncbi:hypothetical protein T10_5331 [Trichinella papuae]|uniref:Uncharacterized protein n=1 Tax=Trichinella papuae TaxID=268474 RepID=A0A0V1M1Z7_9BILA|nr:hypothetical protein T10_5331 [Trichinella papuae]
MPDKMEGELVGASKAVEGKMAPGWTKSQGSFWVENGTVQS